MKTMKKTGATAFGTVIEARRLESGQVRISGGVFDRTCATSPETVLDFIRETYAPSIVSSALT